MSEFKENLKQVERLLKIAQIHEEYSACNNLYDFLGIDRAATQKEIKASIGMKYKFCPPRQNLSDWETLTKAFISSQGAIEYILYECQPEYDYHLIDLKVKALRKHFISLTHADRELDSKEKKELIKEGTEIGLPETQIIKIIDQWMEKEGVKLVEATNSSSDYVPYDALLGKTYYEILGIANNADCAEIKKAYDREYKKFINTGDKARRDLISEGWEILRDSDKREIYDKTIMEPESGVEDGVPVLKVMCKMDNHYVYKDVKKGAAFTETIIIKNDHEGQLKGKIISDAEWLMPERKDIASKHEQTFDIHIVTAKIPVNTYDTQGTIILNTNGGPPYSITFRVILADLEIASDKFRKTYIPLAAACVGFIGSFSGLPLSYFLTGAIFTGIISFSIAKFIVNAALKNGLNLFKTPSILMQGAAGSIVILTILSHFSGSSVIKPGAGQEKPAIPMPPVPVIPQQTLSETDKRPVIADQLDHNQQPSRMDDILSNETIALSGSLTSVDPNPTASSDFWEFGFEAMDNNAHYSFRCGNPDELHFRISGNEVNWVVGIEAMRTHPNRGILYFRSQDWDGVQKCSKGEFRCTGNACPFAIAIEPDTTAQNTLHQPPLADVLKNRSIDDQSSRALRRNTGIASNIAKKKKWKPKTSSFAPPSRDDL